MSSLFSVSRMRTVAFAAAMVLPVVSMTGCLPALLMVKNDQCPAGLCKTQPRQLYDGPVRPAAEVVHLKAYGMPGSIKKLGDLAIPNSFNTTFYEVLPGQYVARVETVIDSVKTMEGTRLTIRTDYIKQDFKAGHYYFVRLNLVKGSVPVEIVDGGTDYPARCPMAEYNNLATINGLGAPEPEGC